MAKRLAQEDLSPVRTSFEALEVIAEVAAAGLREVLVQADREPRPPRERAPQAMEAVGRDVAEPERAGADERVEPVRGDQVGNLRQVVGVADEVLGVEAGPVAQRRVAGGGDAVRR